MGIENNKCVVFDLPSGSGGMAAGMVKSVIMQKVRAFSTGHQVTYITKTERYKLKIWFEKDSHYTLFFLAYIPDKIWRQPYIIEEPAPEDNTDAL